LTVEVNDGLSRGGNPSANGGHFDANEDGPSLSSVNGIL
jgi:hypothetical protein